MIKVTVDFFKILFKLFASKLGGVVLVVILVTNVVMFVDKSFTSLAILDFITFGTIIKIVTCELNLKYKIGKYED